MTTREQDEVIDRIAARNAAAAVDRLGRKPEEAGNVFVVGLDEQGGEAEAVMLDEDGEPVVGATTTCISCTKTIPATRASCAGCAADAEREIRAEQADPGDE